ncbi:13256_t:CDS:2, partial [Racocetra persica]
MKCDGIEYQLELVKEKQSQSEYWNQKQNTHFTTGQVFKKKYVEQKNKVKQKKTRSIYNNRMPRLIATAWNRLKEKEKTRISPQVLYKTLFRETEEEEVTNRKVLIKGLIMTEVGKKLDQLLNRQAAEKCINIVTKTVWNTFYDQIWRVQYEKVQ